MRIAVVGAGNIGGVLALAFAAAGHHLTLVSGRRAGELGPVLGSCARVAPLSEAIDGSDVVIFAVPFGAALVMARRGHITGQIVVDATNYLPDRDGPHLVPDGTTSSELLATAVPDAKVVKAFNTLWSEFLRTERRPVGLDRKVLLLAGDDQESKAVVAGLIRGLGFSPVDTGRLAEGGRLQQPDSALYNQLLTEEEAYDALAKLGA